MKTNYLTLLLLAFIVVACSQEKKQTDWEKNNLRGNVKSVFAIDYKAVDKFGQGQIVKGKPKSYGSEYILFDSVGNSLEYSQYKIGKCLKRYEIELDEKGNRTKWMSFEEDDDTKMRYGSEFKFDEQGNETLEIDLKDQSREIIKNKYDQNGRLVEVRKSNSKETYQYDAEGRLSIYEEATSYRYLKNELRKETYAYDQHGNRVKRTIAYTPKSEYDCTLLSKYDDKNRVIDVIRINNPDPEKGEVVRRTRYSYKDDVALIPNHSKTWGEDGTVETEQYEVWFYNETDTLSTIKLDKDYCMTRIEAMQKKQNGMIASVYDIESELFVQKKYNYSNGLLVSVVDEEGNVSSYEYDGSDLKKITRQKSEGKEISVLDKGRPVSETFYDKHNKVEATTTYEYSGNRENGTVALKHVGADKKEFLYEATFKESKKIQEKRTNNGVAETINYSYNEHGDIELVENISQGETIKYTYKYDPFGNWYQRTRFTDDVADAITERSIEYYSN